MKYGFLVIADNNGVRRVPIGFIDIDSKVIGLEEGQPPVMSGPTLPPPVALRDRPVLIEIALALLVWHLGGVWGLVGYALLMTFLERVGRQAWTIAQTQRQKPLRGVGSASSAPSV